MSERKIITEFESTAHGRRTNLLVEFWDFLKYNKKWWLLPILLILLGLAALVVLGGTGAGQFIYTLF